MSKQDLIQELSLPTKALMIVNEFTTRRMEPPQLTELLLAITDSLGEFRAVIELVENELRAANYPAKTVSGLVKMLSAGAGPLSGDGGAGAPEDTRSMRVCFPCRPPHTHPVEPL